MRRRRKLEPASGLANGYAHAACRSDLRSGWAHAASRGAFGRRIHAAVQVAAGSYGKRNDDECGTADDAALRNDRTAGGQTRLHAPPGASHRIYGPGVLGDVDDRYRRIFLRAGFRIYVTGRNHHSKRFVCLSVVLGSLRVGNDGMDPPARTGHGRWSNRKLFIRSDRRAI